MRINLLPPEERPLKPSAIRWEFVVSLIGILFLAAALVFSWLSTEKLERLRQEHEKALAYEDRLVGQAQQVNSLKNIIASLELEEEVYRGFLGREEKISLIPILTQHSFSQVWIETIAWDQNKIDLVGYSGERVGLSQYLNYLNDHSEQALVSAMQQIEGTDFLTFKIEIRGLGARE
ncbi:MAG: hypothetical protein GX335_00705 [Firmicutes bacterium]|nr:hypothetical protein [Bacillota bacterium]